MAENLQKVLVLCTILLMSCSQSTNNDNSGPGDRPEGHFQLRGNAAIGAPIAWGDICATDLIAPAPGQTPENWPSCTVSLDSGNFGINSLFAQAGLVSHDELELASLYWILEPDTVAPVVNLNPTTALLSDFYLQAQDYESAYACSQDDLCLQQIQSEGINLDLLYQLTERLAEAWGEDWPDIDPWTDPYIADNSYDLDRMHDATDYVIVDDMLNIVFSDEPQDLFACAPLSALLAEEPYVADDACLPGPLERSRLNAYQATTQVPLNCTAIDLYITPDGPQPYGTEISIEYTLDTAANASVEMFFIYELSGSVALSGNPALITPDQLGTHYIALRYSDDQGCSQVEERSIEIINNPENPIYSFGGQGSCYSPQPRENIDINDDVVCIETLDGGTISDCTDMENDMTYSPGLCNVEQLWGDTFLGACEQGAEEVKIYFYHNLRRPSAETHLEAVAREQALCEGEYQGVWVE